MIAAMPRLAFALIWSCGAMSCSKPKIVTQESGKAKIQAPLKAEPGSVRSSSNKEPPSASKGKVHSSNRELTSSKVKGSPEHPEPAKRGDFFIYTRGEQGQVSGKLWNEVFHFRDEGYAVAWGDRGFVLIDRQENEIGNVYLTDNYPDSVQDGVIRMQEGDKVRYFSLRDGKYLNGAWDHASPFDNKIACVCNDCLKSHGEHHIVEGGKSWFINDKGKILRPYTNPIPQCDFGHRKGTQEWRAFVPVN